MKMISRLLVIPALIAAVAVPVLAAPNADDQSSLYQAQFSDCHAEPPDAQAKPQDGYAEPPTDNAEPPDDSSMA